MIYKDSRSVRQSPRQDLIRPLYANMQKASLSKSPNIETRGRITKQTVNLEDGLSVTKITFRPGARWSSDWGAGGGETCQLPHVALVLSGEMAVVMDDGSEEYFSEGDVMVLPPGHDGRCIGDEAAVFVEFSRGCDYFDGWVEKKM